MKKITDKQIDGADIAYDDLTRQDKSLIESVLNRGATRREAMKMLMAGGLSIAAAGSILTFAGRAIAATPVKGGSVKYATSLHGPNDTLDPGLATGGTDYVRQRAHYNSLIQLNDDITPRPELAQEFSSNADASEWTFKLRKDVEWHDGSKFSADDVIYTMNRHYGEKSTSVVKPLVSVVKEWKKVDQYTVKAILDSPFADLAKVLGEKQFKIIKNGTTDFQNPVGTGPYKLKVFNPGVRSLHVRNENYWREGANLDSIEVFAITDAVARVSALLSGDIDMMADLNPKAIKQVEAASGVQVKSVPSGAYLGMCMMLNQSPGNNPDFVKGMKFLQRREKIVRSLLKGQGTVGNDQPINSAYGSDFCKELAITPFDPDQAKHFLKKSGITSAQIQVAEVSPGMTDTVLIWQRECQKVGFDLQVQKVPNDGYWGAVWMKTPMNVTTWNMRPTATIMLDLAYAPDAPWNDTLWKNDRMGKLLKMAKSETDPAIRYELQCEMQALVHDGSGVIIPAHINIVDAHSSKIKGIPDLALGNLGASEWPEFAWKEA